MDAERSDQKARDAGSAADEPMLESILDRGIKHREATHQIIDD